MKRVGRLGKAFLSLRIIFSAFLLIDCAAESLISAPVAYQRQSSLEGAILSPIVSLQLMDSAQATPNLIESLELSYLFRRERAAPKVSLYSPRIFLSEGDDVVLLAIADTIEPLTYTWSYKNQILRDATGPRLDIKQIQPGQAGLYSVTVRNGIGIGKADISLAVRGMPAPGLTFDDFAFKGSTFVKSDGKDSLILITHGRAENWELTDLSWVTNMAVAISNVVAQNWQVEAFNWAHDAGNYLTLLPKARRNGNKLGVRLADQHWKRIHFIGHSAGAALVNEAAATIRSLETPPFLPPLIHTTFLDPGIGPDQDRRLDFGRDSDWVENYYSNHGWDRLAGRQITNACNHNVTSLYPNTNELKTIFDQRCSVGTELLIIDDIRNGHSWPHQYYLNTVTNRSYDTGFGFARSMEATGLDSVGSCPRDDRILCVATNRDTFWKLTVSPEVSLYSDPKSIEFRNSSFTMIVGAPLLSQAINQPTSRLSPVWISSAFVLTNDARLLSFESTLEGPANAILSVYLNTNQVGVIDLLHASSNGKHFLLFPAVRGPGACTLSFRMDTTNTNVRVSIDNVSIGESISNQPEIVEASRSDGAITMTLVGRPEVHYVLEGSFDLVSWFPEGLISLEPTGTRRITIPVISANPFFYRLSSE